MYSHFIHIERIENHIAQMLRKWPCYHLFLVSDNLEATPLDWPQQHRIHFLEYVLHFNSITGSYSERGLSAASCQYRWFLVTTWSWGYESIHVLGQRLLNASPLIFGCSFRVTNCLFCFSKNLNMMQVFSCLQCCISLTSPDKHYRSTRSQAKWYQVVLVVKAPDRKPSGTK